MPKVGQISTTIESKLREDFDVAVARRRMKMKDALAEAIRLWIDRPAGAAVGVSQDAEAPGTGVPNMPINGDVQEYSLAGNVNTGLGISLANILRISQETLRLVQAQGAPRRGKANKTPIAAQVEATKREGRSALRETDRKLARITEDARTRNRPRKTDVA